MDDLGDLDFNINITSNSEETKGESGFGTQPGWVPLTMTDDSNSKFTRQIPLTILTY